MSKRPTDGDEPPAKKRASSRQMTKDDASDDEVEERGSIQTAPEEVMRERRVVKARRGLPAVPSAAPSTTAPSVAPASANPFAGISLGIASVSSGASPPALEVDKKGEAPTLSEAAPAVAEARSSEAAAAVAVSEAPESATVSPGAPTQSGREDAPNAFASFASSTAPFAATAGKGQAFSFGRPSENASANAESGGAAAAAAPGPFSFPGAGFSFQPSPAGAFGSQPLFGSQQGNAANGSVEEGGDGEVAATPPAVSSLPPETATVTGEEDEETLWSGDGTLYEFDAGSQWRERGRGELRVNRGQGRAARLVMRHRGFLRLLMNANLWPEMKATRMDGGKGATFPVVNAAATSEGGEAAPARLQTFAFRLKQADQLDSFLQTIDKYKKPGAEPEPDIVDHSGWK